MTLEQKLIEAAARCDAAQIQELLAAGASVEARSEEGFSLFDVVIGQYGYVEKTGDAEKSLAALIEAGVSLTTKGISDLSPLECAAVEGKENLVRMLQAAGAQPTDVDEALRIALAINDAVAAKAALDAGANPNGYDAAGMHAALHYAAKNGHVEMIELLIAAGAEVDVLSRTPFNPGSTPLMDAAMNGRAAAVRALLAHGARADAEDSGANTALAWALINNFDEIRIALEANIEGRLSKGAVSKKLPPEKPNR